MLIPLPKRGDIQTQANNIKKRYQQVHIGGQRVHIMQDSQAPHHHKICRRTEVGSRQTGTPQGQDPRRGP